MMRAEMICFPAAALAIVLAISIAAWSRAGGGRSLTAVLVRKSAS